jgi:hypothetical protein
MHTFPTASAVRTYAPSPLDEVPPEIWTQIVVNHISLREGRAMTSLACVSRAFVQRMKPHMKPLRLYRTLDNAIQGMPAVAVHACMGTLYDLAQVNPAHRLALFLRVSTTLYRHFPGLAIEPYIDMLLASMQHLEREEQPAALLSLVSYYPENLFDSTKHRYFDMVGRVGALKPSAGQSRLATALGYSVTDCSGPEFPERVKAFLSMCMRLQPVYRIEVINNRLQTLEAFGRIRHYPGVYGFRSGFPSDNKHLEHNKRVLLWGLHECLQSIPIQELSVEEQLRLWGKALVMPICFGDVEEADKMAISLLRMISPGNGDFYLKGNAERERSFDECMADMLQHTFVRDPMHSIHRFQRLYQAMAHLPPSWQIDWMRGIMLKCAKQAERGVSPALIVATAQAALHLNQAQPELKLPIKLLYHLFALCLNPATLRKVDHYPLVEPAAVDPSEQPGYRERFDANCGELMHLLRDAAPDIAGKLLPGINDAYREDHPLKNILPAPRLFRTELYGRFLKQALAFLRGLPPADSAACLLQWKLPGLHITDARHADGWTSSLMTAVAEISRDTDLVSLEQQETVLGELLENGIDVQHHSPARNQRLLAGLAAFPDAVCAKVLVRLLEYRHMAFAHYDVLFVSMIEAARRLPDALRSSVLEAAASGLMRFPDPNTVGITRSTLQQERDDNLEPDYPDLQNSDPGLYVVMRPGHVSRMEGWALLLDAVQTLPAQHQADRLRQLCGDSIFFKFSNNRLSHQDKAQCSMRLLSAIIGLPNDLRGKAFSSWLKHVYRQSYRPEERSALQAALLPMLLALPASEGKPLFDAYLAGVWPAEEKAALRERVALQWKDAV